MSECGVCDAGKVERIYEIGQFIEGKGVYMGPWIPREGTWTSDVAFDLFAAPEDLNPSARTGRSFRAAAEEVASLRNWHGNDGIYLSTERDLFSAIRKGDYVGQWFIPTVEHLVGMRLEGFNPLEGRKASSNNLCDLQDRGAFRDTFGPGYYWSITPEHRAKVFGHEGRFLMVSLTGGFGYLGHADESSLGKNVRPVRAEPRRPFALASPAP